MVDAPHTVLSSAMPSIPPNATLLSLDFLPTRGTNLPTEIQCYSLPYGILGFISHILTYYTISCLYFGRRPFWPCRRLDQKWYDVILPTLGLIIGVPSAIYTMVRCINTWPLLLIAMWKLVMSVVNDAIAIHTALKRDSATQGGIVKWFAFYILGVLIGSPGLVYLVYQNIALQPLLKTLTHLFGDTIAVFLFFGALCDLCGHSTKTMGAFRPALVAAFVLYAFYSDWALGIMAYNLMGFPSSDAAWLYWPYFISKRLTMFSL